jgi:mevalonate kinase
MSLLGNKSYESRTKLMISGEYLVLKGALSLAIPLQFGQRLLIAENEGTPSVTWKSMINNDLWFFAKLLLPDFRIVQTNLPDLSETLRKILLASKAMNSEFLNSKTEYHVTSVMDFNPQLGIGSSSSLISNIAYWAHCDPFKLNYQIFNGSGYDIACARSSSPIIYNLNDDQPQYREANFHPSFYEHLYFVYLNQKQNSKESIKKSDLSKINAQDINEISGLTLGMEKATNLKIFQDQIDRHETLIGSVIKQKPVKMQFFNDFAGSVKSLGAWGGDFILAASSESDDYVFKYFKNNNLNTIFRYAEVVFSTKIN